MAKRKLTSIKTIPFQGGCNTSIEPALIEPGKYSMVQNFRQKHPGFVKRAGQIKQHSTADSTNKVMSMYQFVKGKKTERHFYAQMSDSDVLEATTAPPGVTTGAFGSEVFSGTASPLPASWANVNDFLLFCNGVDLPQINPGTGNFVDNFYVYRGSSDPMIVTNITVGEDFSNNVSDGNSTTYADISSLGTLALTSGTGVELITNGTFSSDTGWTHNGTSISGGVLILTGSGNGTVKSASQAVTIVNGKTYTIVCTIAKPYATEEGAAFIPGPVGDNWAVGNTLTGQSSGATSTIVSKENINYYTIQNRVGSYTVDEIVSNGTYTADQNAYHPSIYSGSFSILIEGIGTTYGPYTSAGTRTIQYTASSPTGTLTIKKSNHLTATIDNLSIKEYISNYHCIFIKTPLSVQSLGFTITAANGSSAVASVKYWNGNSFSDVSGFSDGTSSDGKAFAQSGSMTWTAPTDEISSYFYSKSGFWYMVYLSSGPLDSDTKISSVTYEAAWKSIVNQWDGIEVDIIEAQKYTSSTGAYSVYAASSITLNSMATTDILYFSSYDPIESIFVDALTPNGTGNTLTFYRWNGSAWEEVAITDGTSGFSRSGTIVFGRGISQKQNFNNTGYMAHWYKITTGSALAAAVVISMSVRPYFDITEIGKGQTVAAWKNRAVYGTNQDHYCYLTAPDNPQVLNGDDYTILRPGDGRFNRPICIKNLNDNILIFQEEKGREGGCITKYEWISTVNNIKKAIVSTTLGAMNAKSVDIVDGVEFSELNRDQPIMSLAYFISRTGIYITDGSACYMISQDIANYFDPTKSECIRVGYETEHWLKYDSAYGVIRCGLVSGSSATVPNAFPVYDVKDKTWSFDNLGQALSCMTEAEAGSGNVTVVQLGGGTADGTVYVLNSGLNDVSSAIDSYVTQEIGGKGEILHMEELLLRAKVQTAGNITVTPSLNSIVQTAMTFAQTAEITNQTIRRHRQKINLIGQHISLKIQHNTASESCQLLDIGTALEVYEEQ